MLPAAASLPAGEQPQLMDLQQPLSGAGCSQGLLAATWPAAATCGPAAIFNNYSHKKPSKHSVYVLTLLR